MLNNLKKKLNIYNFDIGYFIRNWKLEIKNFQQGFSLVEVILSASLFGVIVTAMVGAFIYGRETAVLSGERAKAVFLAEEGLEAVRNMRDADFANLAVGNHGLAISGNRWVFSGDSGALGAFTREITIADAGAGRKQIVSNVAWQQTPQRRGSISLITYLTDWRAR